MIGIAVSSTCTGQHIPAGKNTNPKALRVDLMFTVESPKSVSCDAMTNVASCLDGNS